MYFLKRKHFSIFDKKSAMVIEQLYTNCLAQGAYFIEHNGEAAVIDPLREVNQYIELAKSRNAEIKYIFETHFHADFVSGHLTLSEKTGATIVFGPNAQPNMDCLICEDGQEFKLGQLTLRALHTPGHTMESTTYLLIDENGNELAIFTGDTLFLGDVGRPDLAQKDTTQTQEELAGILFDSLRTKIMPLPDSVIVYPGHGAGSACGKNMSKETVGLLGDQKKSNYALRANMSKEEFINEVTDGLLEPPSYFPYNVSLNKNGYSSIENVLANGQKKLLPEQANQLVVNEDALILDVRSPKEFIAKHIKNSLFIGLDGTFAPWVGTLINDIQTPIILVVDESRITEAITRLARVGFDNVLGYIPDAPRSWELSGLACDSLFSISAEQMAENLIKNDKPIIDVRKSTEFQSEHAENALNLPLDSIAQNFSLLPKQEFYLHCAGGYRSVIAASILKRNGIDHFIDISGGFGAMKNTSIKISEYVCPSTF